MRAEYKPQTTDEKLGYLVEECGEVLHAVGKTLRWGLNGCNPELPVEQRETNREWVLRELFDLARAMAFVESDIGEPSSLRSGRPEHLSVAAAEEMADTLRTHNARVVGKLLIVAVDELRQLRAKLQRYREFTAIVPKLVHAVEVASYDRSTSFDELMRDCLNAVAAVKNFEWATPSPDSAASSAGSSGQESHEEDSAERGAADG